MSSTCIFLILPKSTTNLMSVEFLRLILALRSDLIVITWRLSKRTYRSVADSATSYSAKASNDTHTAAHEPEASGTSSLDICLTSRREWAYDWRRHQRTGETQVFQKREDGLHWYQTFWRFLIGLDSSWERNWVFWKCWNIQQPFISSNSSSS